MNIVLVAAIQNRRDLRYPNIDFRTKQIRPVLKYAFCKIFSEKSGQISNSSGKYNREDLSMEHKAMSFTFALY